MRAAWRYLVGHWRGEHSLGRATLVNFLPLFCVLWWLLDPLAAALKDDARVAYSAIIVYCMGLFVPVMVWQSTGVMRSCERYLLNYGNPVFGRAAQAGVIAAALGAIIAAVGAVQEVGARQIELALDREWREKTTRVYDIARIGDSTLARLGGDMQNGTTRELERWLDDNPDVVGLVLDSTGGRVYEGRGVARVVTERNLDTYTFTGCYSACTTAFIAGRRRYVGSGAKLGFHQYRYDTTKNLGYLDPREEQEKDRTWYRGRDIDERFLERVFETPDTEMWFPEPAMLIDYGVIHGIVDPASLSGAR